MKKAKQTIETRRETVRLMVGALAGMIQHAWNCHNALMDHARLFDRTGTQYVDAVRARKEARQYKAIAMELAERKKRLQRFLGVRG